MNQKWMKSSANDTTMIHRIRLIVWCLHRDLIQWLNAYSDIRDMWAGNMNLQVPFHVGNISFLNETPNDLKWIVDRLDDVMRSLYLKMSTSNMKEVLLKQENEMSIGNLYVYCITKIPQRNEFVYLNRMFIQDGKINRVVWRPANTLKKIMDSLFIRKSKKICAI